MKTYICHSCGAIIHVNDKDKIGQCEYCGAFQVPSDFSLEHLSYDEVVVRYRALLRSDYRASQLSDYIEAFRYFQGRKDAERYAFEAEYNYILKTSNEDECLNSLLFLKEIKDYGFKYHLSFSSAEEKTYTERFLSACRFVIPVPVKTDSSLIVSFLKDYARQQDRKKHYYDIYRENSHLIANNENQAYAYFSNIPSRISEINDVSALRNIQDYSKNLLLYSQTKEIAERIDSECNRKIDSLLQLRKQKERIHRAIAIGVPAIIVITIVSLVIWLISSIVTNITTNNYNHSKDRISFNVTSKESYYDPDVSPYVNGCYYVTFYYNITNTSNLGVSYMNINTEVYLNGEDYGTITTSFSDMNLDANATKKFYVTLHDNQPEKNNNTFFLTLYDVDFSALSFTFTIKSVQFSDGHYTY